MKPYADNVVVRLHPLETMSAGGLHLPQQSRQGARGSRRATVVASGPGHYRQVRDGANGSRDQTFIKNETREGDVVLVDALAGQAWEADMSMPRHNKGGDFGDTRIVRESEILAILTDE